jgi:hypothetical protein
MRLKIKAIVAHVGLLQQPQILKQKKISMTRGLRYALSEQELVDCSQDPGYTCDEEGGNPIKPYQFLMSNNFCEWKDYRRYDSHNPKVGPCESSRCSNYQLRVEKFDFRALQYMDYNKQ